MTHDQILKYMTHDQVWNIPTEITSDKTFQPSQFSLNAFKNFSDDTKVHT